MGYVWPKFASGLSFVGVVYLDLLKMIVLPFMLSAIIFSLQKLLRDGGASQIISRVLTTFSVAAVIVAFATAAATQILRPGVDLPPESIAAFGQIIGNEKESLNVVMSLRGVDEDPKELTLREIVASLIPSNIFASLVNAETLKALVFALLFGIAAAQVPSQIGESLQHSLETIYRACSTLTQWINIPLPFVLISMMASQIATTGLKPLWVMAGFVGSFLAICAFLVVTSLITIKIRSGYSLSRVAQALREAFALSVATNNSLTCMPAMVRGMVNELGFQHAQVELLVPLGVTLLRTGTIAYFVCGTMFIAGVYGHELDITKVSLIVLISILSGIASTGMSGLMTVTLIGTICGYIGLPSEAVLVLFLAVDPICAMGRTVITVFSSCAAISVVCPVPRNSLTPIKYPGEDASCPA